MDEKKVKVNTDHESQGWFEYQDKGVSLLRDDRDKSQPKFEKERVVPTNILIYFNIRNSFFT